MGYGGDVFASGGVAAGAAAAGWAYARWEGAGLLAKITWSVMRGRGFEGVSGAVAPEDVYVMDDETGLAGGRKVFRLHEA